jgi:hypothetical protein
MIAGCARRTPQGIAERYIENLRAFDYTACYALLSNQDRAERTYSQFLSEIPLAPDVNPTWFRQVLHQTHYELGAAVRDSHNNLAQVPVEVTTPDLILWERELDAKDPNGQADPEDVQRSLDLGEFPKRIYKDTIYLIREHRHWRIQAEFDERDSIVAQRDRALREDYREEHYDRAVRAWQSMISALATQRVSGSQGLADQYRYELARLEELNSSANTLRLLDGKLQLKNVAMKMSEQRVPGIFGVIRNDTDHPIDAISVAVTWYSGRGKDLKAVFHEQHPVVVTPLAFTDFEHAIIPFMPGDSRDFGFVALAPPQLQQTAVPYVTIGAVALTAPSLPIPHIRRANGPTAEIPGRTESAAAKAPASVDAGRSAAPDGPHG